MRIGKITENALKRSVLKQLRTEYKGIKSAAVGSDCAFSKKEMVFSTTSFLGENISDIGYYSVINASNGLIAQGVEVDHVTLNIILPPDCEEKNLKIIVSDAIEAAKFIGITYAGGHTETTNAVNRPIVVANAVGTDRIGVASFLDKPKPGQDLVVTKWTALEGTAMLAKEKNKELAGRYPIPFIEDAQRFKTFLNIQKEASIAMQSGAYVHDISNGGVFAALWEMAERAGCGLLADLKKIPIRQETIEVCEFFEINPYILLSGGALLVATDSGEKLVENLGSSGIPAVVIGSLREGKDRVIVNDVEERFLEHPQSDEIHRILG